MHNPEFQDKYQDEVWEYLILDLQKGTIYKDIDDETLRIMLLDIWNYKDIYTNKGVIMGNA